MLAKKGKTFRAHESFGISRAKRLLKTDPDFVVRAVRSALHEPGHEDAINAIGSELDQEENLKISASLSQIDRARWKKIIEAKKNKEPEHESLSMIDQKINYLLSRELINHQQKLLDRELLDYLGMVDFSVFEKVFSMSVRLASLVIYLQGQKKAEEILNRLDSKQLEQMLSSDPEQSFSMKDFSDLKTLLAKHFKGKSSNPFLEHIGAIAASLETTKGNLLIRKASSHMAEDEVIAILYSNLSVEHFLKLDVESLSYLIDDEELHDLLALYVLLSDEQRPILLDAIGAPDSTKRKMLELEYYSKKDNETLISGLKSSEQKICLSLRNKFYSKTKNYPKLKQDMLNIIKQEIQG